MQLTSGYFSRSLSELASLKTNKKPVRLADSSSLLALLVPGLGFAAVLVYLSSRPDYAWLRDPVRYPFELWLIALCGSLATCGGIGDWLFHRMYVAAGPRERQAHFLALASGGVPLFILMLLASFSTSPQYYLLPVLLCAIYTIVLICYDEFLFHWKRCKTLETLLHRLLVFGNGTAWLAWMHWCFVRGMIHG